MKMSTSIAIGQERNKMPFKKKPTKVVGINGWEVEVPNPPTHATHARMTLLNDLRTTASPRSQRFPYRILGALKG